MSCAASLAVSAASSTCASACLAVEPVCALIWDCVCCVCARALGVVVPAVVRGVLAAVLGVVLPAVVRGVLAAVPLPEVGVPLDVLDLLFLFPLSERAAVASTSPLQRAQSAIKHAVGCQALCKWLVSHLLDAGRAGSRLCGSNTPCMVLTAACE